MKETNRIEFKFKLNESLEKEVVAFLNYKEGGAIFIGIDDNGKIVGIKNADTTQLKIKDRIKNNIQPSCLGLFDVILEKRENKDIIKINIASGTEKPYHIAKMGMSSKGCFLRIGSAAEPMPLRMIEELFAKRTRNSISKISSNQQELNFEQLKIYYNEAGFKLGDKFAKNLELLTLEGKYNYIAYLMSDRNGNSIKVAKYKGTNRVNLIESNEYGYCSLIKATKNVLNKLEIENKTATIITSKERINKPLWNPIALREAVINAIVHNDFSREVPPKFEIFDDRLEITSAGGLVDGMSQTEFFEGYSVPRNKEIMRIYKDLDMVEHLGSGIPRILQSYEQECFIFTDNFLRMILPFKIDDTLSYKTIKIDNTTNKKQELQGELQQELQGELKKLQIHENEEVYVTKKETQQELQGERQQELQGEIQQELQGELKREKKSITFYGKILKIIETKNLSKKEISLILKQKQITTHLENTIAKLFKNKLIQRTIPEKPKSPKQKYKITEKGKAFLEMVNG